MRLSDRLRQGPVVANALEEPGVASEAFREMKGELHRRLVDRLDLKAIDRLPAERLQEELRGIVASMVSGSSVALNQVERERLVQEILDEVTGLGPLEPLLADGTISDILVNTAATVYVERNGKLELTRVRFDSNDHLLQVINRIVSRVGRRVDETSPMVDARLPDGSRVNAIIPPLAIDGPILSIRRFGRSPLKIRDLLTLGSVTREAISFLAACVTAKLNVLVSGGTGSGKTTMLNALSVVRPDVRADRDHRGLGRAPAPAAPRGPARDPAAEHRGQGGDHRARPGPQRPPHATGPHHRRRGPELGGARHAPGHEHRPRRIDDHHPRQLAARRA